MNGAGEARSLQLIRACRLQPDEPLIAVGAAASHLVEALIRAGYRDVTVLDPSAEALAGLSQRLAGHRSQVTLVPEAVARFHPHRRYALWHDDAVFHRLIHAEERQQYLEALEEALRAEGHLIIATFGPDGPEEEGPPVRRYSAATLPLEFGRHFELAEHSLEVEQTPLDPPRQYLHCRFRRHAPARLG